MEILSLRKENARAKPTDDTPQSTYDCAEWTISAPNWQYSFSAKMAEIAQKRL